jgi:hypothetical protein
MNFDVMFWFSIGGGLFAGLIAVSLLGRWGRFILGLRQSATVTASGESAQIRVLGIPPLAFLSPAPWMCFIGLPFAAYYFIHVRAAPYAPPFFASLGAVILLWIVASVILIRRFRGVPKRAP